MITLIIGGSGSGKSAYAENYTTMLSEKNRKYYLATMQVYNEEGKAKVERHRKLRKNKSFVTVEQPMDLDKALEKIETDATLLLECMSNLVANEMFSDEPPKSCKETVDKVIGEVMQLSGGVRNLVIVSNNLFEDGIQYDETTMEYTKAMGLINTKIAELADMVVEVVVGIPLMIKEHKRRRE